MIKWIVFAIIVLLILGWVTVEEAYEKGYGDGYMEGICHEVRRKEKDNEARKEKSA